MTNMTTLKSWVEGAMDIRRRFFCFNFYRCHMTFFIVAILVSSAILYGSTAPPSASADPNEPGYEVFRIYYIDALFMCASAMTTTGLTSIDLSLLTGYQQSILFILMWLGDLSTVSISVVFVRRWFFQKRMTELASQSRTVRNVLTHVDCERAEHRANSKSGLSTRSNKALSKLKRRTTGTDTPNESRGRPSAVNDDSLDSSLATVRESSRDAKFRGQRRKYASHERQFGSWPAPWEHSFLRRGLSSVFNWFGGPFPHGYLSFDPELDSRGRFRSLTSAQYYELGGAEYRAVQLLSWLLPLYTGFWIFLTMVILTPYVTHYGPVADTIRTSQPGDTNPTWFGVFLSLSAYTNTGLTLLNASMIPFQANYLLLIVTGAAMVAGNTFYPIFLRIFIWILYRLVPKTSDIHHTLSFLLHHPRRCYLFLFDRKTTWILTAVQLAVILGEWVLFEILNINQTAIWALAPNIRVLDGIYQSLGTRSSGFYIVTISSIAPALQIVYIVTMYMSTFPILISLRNTNIYEEQSIGLDVDQYESQSLDPDKKRHRKTHGRHTAQHIRNQLAYDLWWIVLSWFLICIIEEPSLNDDAPGWNNFSVLFEVVSGYGNCGLSLGVPYDDYSLVGTFHVLSKLVMIAVMLRGRHRILPMAIDRSILLPGQGLMEEMDQQYNPKIGEDELLEAIRKTESGNEAEVRGIIQDPEPEKERQDAMGWEQAEQDSQRGGS